MKLHFRIFCDPVIFARLKLFTSGKYPRMNQDTMLPSCNHFNQGCGVGGFWMEPDFLSNFRCPIGSLFTSHS